MNQSSSLLLVVAGALAVTALQPATPTQAKDPLPLPPPPKPLKVAVVDIGHLFKHYTRKDQSETKINADRVAFRKELAQDRLALKAQRKALREGPDRQGSDAWLKARDHLKLAQKAWELKSERRQKALKAKVERSTLRLLKEIESTIATWGKAQDYDLILKIDRSRPKGGGLVQQFQEGIFRAQISDVLYHKNGLDTTAQVVRYLNDPKNTRRFAPKQGDH